jgi:hypothetical protein
MRKSRGGAVGIETGYGSEGREFGVQVPVGSIIFLFTMSSKSVLGFLPASYPMDTGDSYLSN